MSVLALAGARAAEYSTDNTPPPAANNGYNVNAGVSTAVNVAVAPAASASPDYHPSMSDLMTLAVQSRHIKLGLAGAAGNWSYASYELSELRNAFARIGRTVPVYNQVTDTAQLLTAMTQAPLDALAGAIKAHDAAAFRQAYGALTASCNACHASLNHAVIVIRVPDHNPYSDQDFGPGP